MEYNYDRLKGSSNNNKKMQNTRNKVRDFVIKEEKMFTTAWNTVLKEYL